MLKDYIYIHYYKKSLNKLLVIGFLRKFFGFKLFIYQNLKR